MSLLHATWLPAIRTSSSSGQPALLVWADTWRVATPEGPGLTPALHPFTLSHDDLRAWLSERDLLPGGCIDATACLTLPSRTVKPRKSRSKKEEPTPEPPGWTGLPMQAGEPIPKQTEWWPWQVQGLAVEPSAATEWLSRLPLSGTNPDLADELLWWSHLQRWALSLVARGRWIPQMELSKGLKNY